MILHGPSYLFMYGVEPAPSQWDAHIFEPFSGFVLAFFTSEIYENRDFHQVRSPISVGDAG